MAAAIATGQDCTGHIMAHEQALIEAKKRLDKIESDTSGLPQEMQFIRQNVDRICVNMDKLMEKLESRYIPRELFDTTINNMEEQIHDKEQQAEKREAELRTTIEKLDDKITLLTRGGLLVVLYLLKDLVMLAVKH